MRALLAYALAPVLVRRVLANGAPLAQHVKRARDDAGA